MDFVKGVRGIYGKLSNLLPVVRKGIVCIAIGPQPQLGIRVEAVSQDRQGFQGKYKITDVLHFYIVKRSLSGIDLRAWVRACSRLSPVESPVPVRVSSLTA